MISGAGGNIVVQTGPDGVLLVDSGSSAMAVAVLAELRKLSNQPIRYIINTSADVDHVGGNEKIAQAGESLFLAGMGAGGGSPVSAASNNGGASIIATEQVLERMSAPTGTQAPFPTVAWPTETFTRKEKALYLNGEGIEVISASAAHSDGDTIVFFRRSDVIATGDTFDLTQFPVIDVAKGGSVQGEIDALNRVMQLAIPVVPLAWKPGGTKIVPGHGRIAEQAEVVEYRDMVTIIRDRVQDSIGRNMTLDQIKAAEPTKGYTTRYGVNSGPWTTSMFVEAVYASLTAKRK
jgi:glyoxylase-like metal-dependent hydrolase (beta-lactamase superfamily II)